MKNILKRAVRRYDFFIKRIDQEVPFVYFDIGSMDGLPRKWNPLRGAMKIVGFEPDAREFNKLETKDNAIYLDNVIYTHSTDLKYYITRGRGKSSILKPNRELLDQFMDSERFDIVAEEHFSADKVRSLDIITSTKGIKDVDFLKLDTQGSELKVLEGSQARVLPKIFGIQIEVEFIPMYKDQPLFRDIDLFLSQNGFQLIDVRRYYWKRRDFFQYVGKGQLVTGDALYFKSPETLLKEWQNIKEISLRVSKIYKCILTCVIYKMFDYAIMLASIALRSNFFAPRDYELTVQEIRSLSRWTAWLQFPGKSFLYKIGLNICERLKPFSYLGWADSDRMIGNIKDI